MCICVCVCVAGGGAVSDVCWGSGVSGKAAGVCVLCGESAKG